MSKPPGSPASKRRDPALVAEAVVCGLFMLLGLYVCIDSVTELGVFDRGQAGPGILPLLIGVTLLVTTATILFRIRGGLIVDAAEAFPDRAGLLRSGSLFVLATLAALAAPVIGTILTLFLLTLLDLLLIEKRGWPLSLAAAVLIPGILFLLFELVLGVPLPPGLLGLL